MAFPPETHDPRLITKKKSDKSQSTKYLILLKSVHHQNKDIRRSCHSLERQDDTYNISWRGSWIREKMLDKTKQIWMNYGL